MSHFVLVDCNNFFVSCERVFNPRLEGRPVIVLSNNDGCVVARSQEAKKIGIAMGEPFFKVKELCERRKVVVCSSNFRLYGDLSKRVMTVLATMADDMQVYSIDEAFLSYPSTMTSEEVFDRCVETRRKIKKWIGIPTSLGIAPTKTLAKVATKLAKTQSSYGVFDLSSTADREAVLKEFPIREVWGIGARLEAKLHGMGIQTAWDFCQKNPSLIRHKLGVVGERMLWELCGVSCLPLEEAQMNKSISCSRSFGAIVSHYEGIAEALSTHVASACEKLRQQHSCATVMYVYAMALVDSKTGERRCCGETVSLPHPSNSTPEIIHIAKEALSRIFCQGERYKKCGVVMMELVPEDSVAPDLFLGDFHGKHRQLLATVDALNARFGKNTLFYGAMGIDRGWAMRCDKRSLQYTTCWDELAIVRA